MTSFREANGSNMNLKQLKNLQSNFNGTNPDGSFTMDELNSF